MYKVAHEFSFKLGLNGESMDVTGQLIFQGLELNELGMLTTEDQLNNFQILLNSLNDLPMYWTIETLCKDLYDRSYGVFTTLTGVVLWAQKHPHRVAEYTFEREVMITEVLQ